MTDAAIAQGSKPLMIHHAVPVGKASNQFFNIMLSLRRHADVHHLGIYQADRLQPGGAAARICYQLGFVNHGGFEVRAVITEFNGRGNDLRVFDRDGLFSGQHAAGNACCIDAVEHLQRQQAQRAEIGAGQVLLQVFNGIMRLAAVGGADVQDKRALQQPGTLNI